MNNSISLDVSIIYTQVPPVNVTPEYTAAINSQCWQGSGGGITMWFVKWETYRVSFEEFDAQFIDLGAHIY